MGGLTWLVTSTRPDINVATNMLSKFNSCPARGHMEAAKYVLRYLKGTSSHGIWFTENDQRLCGHVGFQTDDQHLEHTRDCMVFTDSCWGPQDASKPKKDIKQQVHLDEMNSVQGHYITRMGGAVSWGVHREPRVSGSSCEAEIKAMDEGVKGIQFLRHLMEQLNLRDPLDPIPIINDNQGSVDWVNHGGVATKGLRHANIKEAHIAEAQKLREVKVQWIPGRDNPADLYTKEHKDTSQFNKLRDFMVRPREWAHSLQNDANEVFSTSNLISTKKAAKRVTYDPNIVYIGTVECDLRDGDTWLPPMGGANKKAEMNHDNPNLSIVCRDV